MEGYRGTEGKVDRGTGSRQAAVGGCGMEVEGQEMDTRKAGPRKRQQPVELRQQRQDHCTRPHTATRPRYAAVYLSYADFGTIPVDK